MYYRENIKKQYEQANIKEETQKLIELIDNAINGKFPSSLKYSGSMGAELREHVLKLYVEICSSSYCTDDMHERRTHLQNALGEYEGVKIAKRILFKTTNKHGMYYVSEKQISNIDETLGSVGKQLILLKKNVDAKIKEQEIKNLV